MQDNKQAVVVDEVVGIPTDSIIIGSRFRQRYNNIDELAESISAYGLHNPITVTPHPEQTDKYILVSGGRRLKAFQKNNAKVIPAIVKVGCAVRLVEAEENNQREPFTPFEKLAIAETLMETIPDRRGRPQKGTDGDSVTVIENKCSPLGTFLPPAVLRKGEKRDDVAVRLSGIGSKGNLDRIRKVRDNAIVDVQDALERGAISINCAYDISLEAPGVQLSRLNESLTDGDVDRKKLRELNRKRREEKRLAARNISAVEVGEGFRADMDDIYNLIYAALGSNTKQKDIDALAKFPLRRHGKGEPYYRDLLVAISCPNGKTDLAMQLLRAWDLDYLGITIISKKDQKPVSINELGRVTACVVFAQFEKGDNVAFREACVPSSEHSPYPHLHPKAFITRLFDVEKPLLDITAPKGSDTLGGVWVNYADKYYDVK